MIENENAFTLFELLATIVILAVILVIAIPKVLDIINDTKISTLESTAKMIASAAEKRKLENNVFGIDKVLTCEDVVKINDLDYESCKVKYTDGKFDVTIIGSGRFEGMYICKGTKTNSKVTDYCINEDVSIVFNLDGGDANKNQSGIYTEGFIFELLIPQKKDSYFTGWKVIKGNSSIKNNMLTVGNTDTIIYAEWESMPLLTVDLNDGTTEQKFDCTYKSETNLFLENPSKTGYTFSHWSVVEGNSVVSGNNLTIGSENTTILANYISNNYTLEYELNGGKFDNEQPSNALYDSVIKINNPTKIGYKFLGWTISGLNKDTAKYGDSFSNVYNTINNITLGEYFINLNSSVNGNVKMTANWEFIPDLIVYEHNGEYVFDGKNYIDTGISLFNKEYINVNFEVSFSILNVEDEQETNAALFNSLNEADENYPGILFRVKNTTTNYEVLGNNKVNNFLQRSQAFSFEDVTNVKIIRINKKTYYSVNDSDYYELQDYTSFSEYFDVPITFGASIDETGQPFRYFKGTLSNMKIKFLSENASIDAYSLKYYFKDSTTFNGTNYINTNVYLFNEENIEKDFKISLTLSSFSDSQVEYATILNSLDESNENYPGFLFRFKKTSSSTTTTQAEIVTNGVEKVATSFEITELKTIVLIRNNNKLYYSINGEEIVEVLDYYEFDDYFNVPVTIGASLDEVGNPFRYFNGSISNVEIMVKEKI